MNQPAPDPYSVPLESIDLSKPEVHQPSVMHRYFERIRNENPVHYSEGSECGPFWSLTKHADILNVNKNFKDFSSDSTNGGHCLGYENLFDNDPDMQWPMFIAMDPPRHNDQRKAVSPAVSPINIKQMEAKIRANAQEILDSLPEDEPFNWVDTVSVELTTRTLAMLFDFPHEERHDLIRWSDHAFATPGDGLIESWADRKAVMLEMQERFEALREERKNNTDGVDMVSIIANPIGGEDLSRDEYMGNVVLLLVGGNDTTRNSITASALAVNRFPEENERLRKNPQLLPSFISEVIRWHTPLPHMKRTAMKDVEIRGKKIAKGEKIVMWYISGNRDEEVFERPHDVIIDRPNVRNHVAFGFGLHRCVGNRLAELQLRIIWEEILKRFASIETVSEPVRIWSNALNGYSEYMVRVKRY